MIPLRDRRAAARLLGGLLLAGVALAACADEPGPTDPGKGAGEEAGAGAESSEVWVDPEPKKIIQLPPKWKEAGMPLAMLNPHLAREEAPDVFRVELETTKGTITVEFVRAWSPHGVDRVYNLVKIGFLKDIAINRVLEGFVAQFGMHGTAGISHAWSRAFIADDPPMQSNRRGYVAFANSGPNTRTTQLFINLADNEMLDQRGFAPVGRVVSGLRVADRLYSGYGEQVKSQMVMMQGNKEIRDRFPKLDWVIEARFVEE
jgi:cyclophilin family peptidyl-prolyl cis-trans isomerase